MDSISFAKGINLEGFFFFAVIDGDFALGFLDFVFVSSALLKGLYDDI